MKFLTVAASSEPYFGFYRKYIPSNLSEYFGVTRPLISLQLREEFNHYSATENLFSMKLLLLLLKCSNDGNTHMWLR